VATTYYPDLNSVVLDVAELLRPSERLTVSQSAEKYRQLNNPGSYVGPWKNATTPYMIEPMDTLGSRDFTSCVFVGPAQCGKGLALDTPIITPSGWTAMGALSVGDQVYGADGKPTTVVFVSGVHHRPCYEVAFDNGDKIVTDDYHKWLVEDINRPGSRVLTTPELMENFEAPSSSRKGWRSRYAIRTAEALSGEHKDLPLDPYFFGVWLGDGKSSGRLLYLNSADSEILQRISERGFQYSVKYDSENCLEVAVDLAHGVSKTLRDMGVRNCKRIPGEYLRASREQRMELLRGLVDTDGHTDKRGRVSVASSSISLTVGVQQLLASLGFKYKTRTRIPKFRYKGEVREGKLASEVLFLPDKTTFSCYVTRKNSAIKEAGTTKEGQVRRHWVVGVKQVETVPTVCIQVDAHDHLFLAGRTMIPTHNTDALLLNWAAYNVICDPADMILYQTSQATARDFSKRRIDRLHRHTPKAGELLLDRRDADNAYDKHYKSGIMITLSWPSINEMSGRPVGRVALTDYDRMPSDIDGEGNPFDLAKKRTTTYRSFAMTLAESSPGHSIIDPKWLRSTPHEAPPCEGILALYNRGDKRRWVWPCPHCKEYFEGEFSMLEWPETLDVEEAGDQAKMRCPNCQELISPDHKSKMNAAGQWIREGEHVRSDGTKVGKGQRSSMASFWMKGVAAAFASWKNLVVNFINAEREYERTGSEEALKSTINTDQGEVYFPRSMESLRTPEELKSRAEDWPEQTVPEGTRFLIATVDVQKNMWVVQVQGFGVNGDKYIVDRFDIRKSKRKDEDGDTLWVKPGTHLEDWDLIEEQVMDKTYPLDDNSGRRMSIKLTGCDSGGRDGVTQKAYEYWRKLRSLGRHHRFRLLKGDSSPGAPRVRVSYPDSQRKDRSAGARGEIPIVMINTNIIKDHLNNTLDRRDMSGGRVSFPSWLPDHFFQELTAEIRTPKGWENPRGARNEAWDLMVYAEALWLHLSCEKMDWDKPDSWAKPWDENDLVFGTSENNQKIDTQPKRVYDLAKLAEALA